jgi:hypothetical protein
MDAHRLAEERSLAYHKAIAGRLALEILCPEGRPLLEAPGFNLGRRDHRGNLHPRETRDHFALRT